MSPLRSPETTERYNEYIEKNPLTDACPLCSKSALKEFTYWKIVENTFPYDLIAKTHHMIIPHRHVTEAGLSEAEIQELSEIKIAHLESEYDYIMEATTKTKSIPTHFHLHLLVITYLK